jgi:hypothetical protein
VTTTPTDFPTGDFARRLLLPGAFFIRTLPTTFPQAPQRVRLGSQLFYIIHFLHDCFNDAGFDRSVRQRASQQFRAAAGLGNDCMNAPVAGFSVVYNANMLTPADGSRPRMRMYNFTSPLIIGTSRPAGIAGKKNIGISQTGIQNFDITSDIVIAHFLILFSCTIRTLPL